MTEEQRARREHRLADALAHAAVPPAAEALPPEPRDEPRPEKRAEPAGSHDALAVESGPTVERIEELFPLIWLGMLTVVCIVGVYGAVSNLP